ncbi:hypothetical protein BGZ65_005837 [Modicella reniformis]|uniref:Uncharacterized protein n=1 Tax=Modicella reniformis TaxID=1440133 RepID=A0A9P6JLJ5_9FUNG|nr:hypothetical protein BGZ65_005837 [Modicella reniformis]
MVYKSNVPHEVHMMNHPGYDLVNPNEFFDKYGTYLLTMMYMVKYGTDANGRKVPLLLGLHYANDIEGGQEHLDFVKKDIRRLVNDTILYLEEAVGVINEDLDVSAYRKLGNLDLEQLQSYLQIKHGESVTGDLRQTTTQDGNCVWICSEHQLEYYKSAMQRLKNVITASGGLYHEMEGEIEIEITSDELAKRVFDGMVKMCGILNARNVLSPIVLELKLESIKNPTAGIIPINLSSLNSLLLDFGRHSVTFVISQGEVKDVNLKIGRLGDLSLDVFELIKQCHITNLEIHALQQADEDRLVSILQHMRELKGLHTKCLDERSLSIIDLVISTREKILQSGESLALTTFKLMREGNIDTKCASGKYHDSIEATVSFSEGSATFEIETDIQLQKQQLVANDDPVCKFVRRYGWSIKTLCLPWSFSDQLAALLDETTQERGSRIVDLDVNSMSLTTSGFDAMDRTINRSQLLSFKFYIWGLGQGNMWYFTWFLITHGRRLTVLSLGGDSIENWPQPSQATLTKQDFPVLQELNMHGCALWIASMVAASPQPSHISPTTPPSTDDKLPARTRQRGLKHLNLNFLTLQREDWKAVINAIDLSVLERLNFTVTNFSQKELTILVDRIAEYASRTLLPSRYMYFKRTDLRNDDLGTLALFEKLQKLLPEAQVTL